ncbi:MAG: ABC transporter substrate-binding protein [Flavobacteriales bacterium]
MRSILPLFAPLLLMIACASPEVPREREGAGGRYYGGVFNANETEQIRSLFPLSLTQAAAHRIGAQVYEGLVRFDQGDLSIRPALAESWEVDDSGTVYTFKLREGVRFHDNACFRDGKGRTMTGADILRCFTALCTYSESNQMDWLLLDRVLGANTHYTATIQGRPSDGVKGFELLDENTFRITLDSAWPAFLQLLAHQGCWIYPQELLEHYGAQARWEPVGTGPFRKAEFRVGEVLILERNEHYWDSDEQGNALPFLDAVRYTFVSDKEQELDQFEAGRLSLVYELPVGRTDVLETYEEGRFQVQTIPGLTVQFYGFNRSLPPFDNVLVRRAFSMAIDRQFLVDSVLKGLAVPAGKGVVAPGFADYPYDSVPDLVYDPQAARSLLAEAGYPGGAGLPAVFLQVNNTGFGYVRVAGEVQGILERNIGANVVSTVLPSDQHFGRVERGEASFWREGWVVDHPDPENFLALFFGRNAPANDADPAYLNSTRYKDARFDSLYALALQTSDQEARMELLALAERRLMEDAVVLPLYHERSVRLLQAWVRDLPINGMEYRDLRAVWFDPALRRSR